MTVLPRSSVPPGPVPELRADLLSVKPRELVQKYVARLRESIPRCARGVSQRHSAGDGEADWVIAKAAKMLGMSYRTLQYRLDKFGVKKPEG